MKIIKESNELETRSKKHKKKQKGLSPFSYLNTDAGNVEKGVEVFNNSTFTPDGGSIGGMGESLSDSNPESYKPDNSSNTSKKYSPSEKSDNYKMLVKKYLRLTGFDIDNPMSEIQKVHAEVEKMYKDGGLTKKDYFALSKKGAEAERSSKYNTSKKAKYSDRTAVSTTSYDSLNQQSAGGQKHGADIVSIGGMGESLSEELNRDQLKAIKVIQRKYPYVTITTSNMKNGNGRVVIDSREFNANVAIEKLESIVNDIDMLIGSNYQIKYEKPLEQKELNYPNYKLFRLVVSIEPLPQVNRIDDIIYNPNTDSWEMNGMQFVNYEDALEYVDEVIK